MSNQFEPKLSVVVPIGNYNRDKTNLFNILSRLTSKRAHLKISIEVILILDNQNETAFSELKEFVKYDSNVMLIATSHGNPGGSRNEGIKFSSGEWICFWDSDDTPNILTLAEIDLNSPADLIVFGFRMFESNSCEIHRPIGIGIENLRYPGVWRYIFRRDFISGITFPELSIGEDQVFLARVYSRIPKLEFSQKIIYNYMLNTPNSLTKGYPSDQLEAALLEIKLLTNKLEIPECDYLLLQITLTCILHGNIKTKCLSTLVLLKSFFKGKITFKMLAIKFGIR